MLLFCMCSADDEDDGDDDDGGDDMCLLQTDVHDDCSPKPLLVATPLHKRMNPNVRVTAG